MNSPSTTQEEQPTSSPPTLEMGKEYRSHRREQAGHQWFYDEFSSIYRHMAPDHLLIHPPTPSSSSFENQHYHRTTTPPLLSSFHYSTSATSHHGNNMLPESIEQVHVWRERACSDPVQMLQLCMSLIDSQPKLVTAAEQLPPEQHQQQMSLAYGVGKEAFRLLKRLVSTATNKRVAGEAQFLLGNCYGTGQLGVSLDHERAFLWYTQASKQNHAEATYRTGVCYELGIGTCHDERRAFTFYRKAAHLAHPTSMYKLAIVYWHGYCGQPIHAREAISWLQRALSSLPEARYMLAMLILYSDNTDALVVPDKRYAIDLLHDAAKHGHTESQLKLAQGFLHGGKDALEGLIDQDKGLGVYWYARAIHQSCHPEAAIIFSILCLAGTAYPYMDQSDQYAYQWACKAVQYASRRHARFGTDRWILAKACYLVAVYIDQGIGIETSSSSEMAIPWFQKAASLGHLTAARRISSHHQEQKQHQEDNKDTSKQRGRRRKHFTRHQCIAM
ncbi:hypothetical protein LRAMOSA06044 [Lichtheimia ramosa]|uniref:HCP-like protein n=1 Tax=Lichtheimia ramosa TaxID=688394 RepID=A0A077X2Q9_9FUNG|nr:hypothetical protein LRAMOSA06044 [Lichtheimia ramosa]